MRYSRLGVEQRRCRSGGDPRQDSLGYWRWLAEIPGQIRWQRADRSPSSEAVSDAVSRSLAVIGADDGDIRVEFDIVVAGPGWNRGPSWPGPPQGSPAASREAPPLPRPPGPHRRRRSRHHALREQAPPHPGRRRSPQPQSPPLGRRRRGPHRRNRRHPHPQLTLDPSRI